MDGTTGGIAILTAHDPGVFAPLKASGFSGRG
jgi:hypothetical protein